MLVVTSLDEGAFDMCRYGNAYIPKSGKSEPSIPATPDGLKVSFDEPFQINFSALHKDDNGVLVAIHDGHCLCDYKNWKQLFDYLESLRIENDLEKVEFLLYWSDSVYPLTDRIVIDMGLDSELDPPIEGVIYEITLSISRRLETYIGQRIHLTFKSGRELRGILSTYDSESGNASLQCEAPEETVYFHFKEIVLAESIG